MKRLDKNWIHSNCPIRKKLITADAVIRAKLLYGLDSAQLNEPQLKRLDIFQLKVIRKILQLKTTYINRQNTNEEVYRQANQKLEEERGKKKITTFRQAYTCSKIKRLKRIINKGNREPVKEITFENIELLKTRTPPNRKRQRPIYKWAERAILELWQEIQKTNIQYNNTGLDLNREDIRNTIKDHCKNTENK